MQIRTPQRRRARIAALAGSIALLAAACGGSDFDDGDDAADDGAEPTGEAPAEGVELTLMGWSSSPAEDDALNAIISSYNEQSENTVQFNPVPEYDTALQAALAGGTPPDVIYIDSNRLPDLVEAGALAPAEGNVEDDGDFYESLRNTFTYDGTFWCPPKDFSTLALVYNVDMFEEAGLEPPTTWEDLAAAAEALTDGDRVGLAIAPEYPRWGVFMFQAGGAVTNEDVTEMAIDSDANREALGYLEELYANGYAATPTDLDAGWAGEAFGQQRAAMTIEGNWIVGAMNNDFPDVNWAVAELPAGPAGQGTFVFTVCYGVPSASQNPEAAWDLVNYLVSPDSLIEFTGQFPVMPGRESLAGDWTDAHPELGPFLSGADYARPFQFVPGFQAVVDTLNDGIQGIAAGNRDVDEVIRQVDEAGQAELGG
ncbi:MAG TPA: ABC transporter substrate-binding protein [Jiangellaceae bacterium]